jgi:succinate dehydrogenase / fumarate reductase iron-sulfur subunit
MRLNLKVWRQEGPNTGGRFVDYTVDDVSPDMSFLEMLDVLNIELAKKGETPVQFDHDCREGICGSCSLVINGAPHGPETGTATCQLHMRRFNDGETIVIEPWRAKAFPVLKDLSTNRTALDRIIAAGGFVSVNTGNAPDGNTHLIPRDVAEEAMDSAACIGCGACVAACKNASAMLFVAAKVKHLALLPQGQPERGRRAAAMVAQMEEEGFGACSNTGACEAACPKEIKLENIAWLNRELLRTTLRS